MTCTKQIETILRIRNVLTRRHDGWSAFSQAASQSQLPGLSKWYKDARTKVAQVDIERDL